MLSAIAERHVEFIAHIGDFKSGSSRCDDALFEDRYKLFQNSRVPFIFVPGDNEWTDCERLSNGAYDPLERLGKLRRLFWEDEFSLGKTSGRWNVRQEATPSIRAFALAPSLRHAQSARRQQQPGADQRSPPEFLARNPVVLAWLRDSFNLANREQLAGIVLLFQANPGFAHFAQGFPHRGYREFLVVRCKRNRSNSRARCLPCMAIPISAASTSQCATGWADECQIHPRVETHGYPQMGWTLGVIDTDLPTLFRFGNTLACQKPVKTCRSRQVFG